MLRVFIGFDHRQPIAFNVCQFSIAKNASVPVSITPLVLEQVGRSTHPPFKRRGLTDFTYTRFLVPYLCGFEGRAIFMDPDMIVTGDIKELFDLDLVAPVHMMKDQPDFEWPSLMVFDCSRLRHVTPDFVTDENMFDYLWTDVGPLPKEWNHCIGYEEAQSPKLLHYTKGIPVWKETESLEPDVWHDYWRQSNSTVSHEELMGTSIHAINQ